MSSCKIAIYLSLLFFASCSNKVDENVEKEMIATIEQNNRILNEEAEKIYNQIAYKLRRSETEDLAYKYLIKAKIADSLFKNIDSILSSILSNSNNSLNTFQLVKNYENNLLKIDTNFKEYFVNSFRYSNDSINNSQKKKSIFIDEIGSNNLFFNLNIYKNKITLLRNHFFDWCYNQINGGCDLLGYSLCAISSQNSTHFKPNEFLEIRSGVGAFNNKPQLKVLVDNEIVLLNNEGVAEYKQNVGTKKGKFTKKIIITYMRPNGEMQKVDKQIIYTVD